MKASSNSKALKLFRRNPWPFQATFQTPLKDLERFVSTFIAVHQPIEGGSVTIDSYVFEPKTLNALLAEKLISQQITHAVSLEAEGQQEVEVLLRATLADWIDFLFIPSPRRFAIYTDHDEYTTFYANTKGNLSKIVGALREKGFREVDGYGRDPIDIEIDTGIGLLNGIWTGMCTRVIPLQPALGLYPPQASR